MNSLLFLLFALESVFGLIPASVLIVLSVIILWFTIRSYISRPLLLVGLVLILLLQLATVTAWTQGWTAATAFERFYSGEPSSVFDPAIERYAMYALYPGIVALVALLIRTRHLRSNNSTISPKKRRLLRKAARVAAVLEILVLLCILSNMATFRNREMGTQWVRAQSPDGSISIQLVPMNCMTDINGLVLYRKTGEFWWHPIARIGDVLTQSSGGHFKWLDHPKRVQFRTICNEEQRIVFEHPFDNE